MKFFSYFLLFVSTCIFTQEALDLYSFSSKDHEQRFYSLAEEISCPLCEGSSINGSTSPIAKDMKNIIFTSILGILCVDSPRTAGYIHNAVFDFV